MQRVYKENVCSLCKALSSTYISNVGCVCDIGYYQSKSMNYTDACKPCNSTCKECKSENVCSVCLALNSKYTTNLGCTCDIGFYKAKEMKNSDACESCQLICRECKKETLA